MGQFKFSECDIEGMFIVEPAVFGDNRGYFMETYNENDFKYAISSRHAMYKLCLF